MSAAWPTDQGDAPTARAISERIVKIRAVAKSNGGSHFTVSSAKGKGAPKPRSATTSTNVTPRKSLGKKADGKSMNAEGANEDRTNGDRNFMNGAQKRKREAEIVKVEDVSELAEDGKDDEDDDELYGDGGEGSVKRIKSEETLVDDGEVEC